MLTWFLVHFDAFMFHDDLLSHIQFEYLYIIFICPYLFWLELNQIIASSTKSSESDTATSMAYAGTPWRLAEAQAHQAKQTPCSPSTPFADSLHAKAAQAIEAVYEKARQPELFQAIAAINDKANHDKAINDKAINDKTHAKGPTKVGSFRLWSARQRSRSSTHGGIKDQSYQPYDKIASKISHIRHLQKIDAVKKANKIDWASKAVPHTAKTGSYGQPYRRHAVVPSRVLDYLYDGCDSAKAEYTVYYYPRYTVWRNF